MDLLPAQIKVRVVLFTVRVILSPVSHVGCSCDERFQFICPMYGIDSGLNW